jgi:transmembrane sensor
MELNTATKVRASIDGRVRNVWLDHGEAYFEVAHDRAHPFVVHAGNRTITVLGTKFSVRRDGGQVYVAVVEGRVRVEDAGAPLRKQLAVLTAGDMALTKGSSTLLTPRSADRVADALSWRQGRLIFDQSTLGDAAEEFNRYNRKQLIVTDPAVAKIRIGGDFDADNVDAFVRLLQEAFGLKIQATGEELRISG